MKRPAESTSLVKQPTSLVKQPRPRPRKPAECTPLEADLCEALARLDRRSRAAVLVILETMVDLDRKRAARLIDAVSTLVAMGPRRRGGGK